MIQAANDMNTKIGSLGQTERATQALEMAMHLTQSMGQQVQGYKNKLERLSENIKTPAEISIVQNLLQAQRYCSELICYSDANNSMTMLNMQFSCHAHFFKQKDLFLLYPEQSQPNINLSQCSGPNKRRLIFS